MNVSTHTPNIGLLSVDATFMEFKKGTRTESHVKVATLFYDELIWPTYDKELVSLVESLPLTGKQQSALKRSWKALDALPSLPEGHNLLRFFSEPSKPPYSRAGHHVVFSAIKEQIMVENNWDEAKWNDAMKTSFFNLDLAAADIFTWGIVDVWKATRDRLGCRLAAFSAPELVAAVADTIAPGADSIPLFEQAISLHVPSFGGLTWDEVLGLRREPGLAKFRSWLSSIGSPQNIADQGQRAVENLWSALDRVMPNLKAELLKAVVCELPGVGELASIRDIVTARRFTNEFGWLVFLHKMRDAQSAKS